MGYVFQYASCIFLHIGIDLSESFNLNFNFGTSSWQIAFGQSSDKIEANINLVAIFLLGFLALGGFSGSYSMITKPDGSGLGMSTELLKRAPVDTYFAPGIFLLLVMCAWPFATIFGLVTDAEWVKSYLIVLGGVSIGWFAYQYTIIRTFSWFQPIISGVGLILLVVGLSLL